MRRAIPSAFVKTFTPTALFTPVAAIGSYALFMQQSKDHPDLKGISIPDRGRKNAELYRALSPDAMAKLKSDAAAIPMKPRKNKKIKRQISYYGMFFKAHGSDDALKGLSIGERGKKLTKMYHAMSTSEKEKILKDLQAINATRAPQAVKKLRRCEQYLQGINQR